MLQTRTDVKAAPCERCRIIRSFIMFVVMLVLLALVAGGLTACGNDPGAGLGSKASAAARTGPEA